MCVRCDAVNASGAARVSLAYPHGGGVLMAFASKKANSIPASVCLQHSLCLHAAAILSRALPLHYPALVRRAPGWDRGILEG